MDRQQRNSAVSNSNIALPTSTENTKRAVRNVTASDSPTLHTRKMIFSARHVLSWLLLSMSAGGVNASAFLACEQFVSHVTGATTQLGLEAGTWALVLDSAVIITCFVIGAMMSAFFIDRRFYRGKRPHYASPLILVAVILMAVSLAGMSGVFGPFIGSVEIDNKFVMLAMLSFAMGLQNASVASSTGMMVRTTHLTGPATDLGINLATFLSTRGAPRRKALHNALLRAGKIVGFFVGAAVMVPIASRIGYPVFFIPTAMVLLSVALSFTTEGTYQSVQFDDEAEKSVLR